MIYTIKWLCSGGQKENFYDALLQISNTSHFCPPPPNLKILSVIDVLLFTVHSQLQGQLYTMHCKLQGKLNNLQLCKLTPFWCFPESDSPIYHVLVDQSVNCL